MKINVFSLFMDDYWIGISSEISPSEVFGFNPRIRLG